MKSYLVKVSDDTDRRVTALSKEMKIPKYDLLPLLVVQGIRYEKERTDSIDERKAH